MKKQSSSALAAVLYALLAALLYALNTPLSKRLLSSSAATYTAGFLYLGAGFGVGIMYLFAYRKEPAGLRLSQKDFPYTFGMVVLDILAPILLMWGIQQGSAAEASLLGNFEIVATALAALLLFREKVSARLWAAVGCITAASLLLSFDLKEGFTVSGGSLLVLGATLCWGLENNCTRRISDKSTYEIVTVKGLCSGAGSLAVAALRGEKMPGILQIGLILLLGYVAYGLSIFCYIRAQRTLGAARTGAYYAVAPFLSAGLSFLLLNETLTVLYLPALGVMSVGAVLAVADTLRR